MSQAAPATNSAVSPPGIAWPTSEDAIQSGIVPMERTRGDVVSADIQWWLSIISFSLNKTITNMYNNHVVQKK